MLKSAVQSSSLRPSFLCISSSPCLQALGCTAGAPFISAGRVRQSGRSRLIVRCDTERGEPRLARQSQAVSEGAVTVVKAVVTSKAAVGGVLAHLRPSQALDDVKDLVGKTLLLELVSTELDAGTGKKKEPLEAFAQRESQDGDEVKYEAEFSVPKGFGEIGAVLVTNGHHREMYLNHILLTTEDETTTVSIDCRSWVHSKFDNPDKRIFFTTESYLPSETPAGLVELRKKELNNIRGDGTGERKAFDRIYDYDTYNDLGDPDSDDKARPVLGGTNRLPYPRRCRTGRPKSDKDPLSETKGTIYVPRDEAFSEVKGLTFSAKTLRSVLNALVPSIKAAVVDKDLGFPSFKAIDSLFDEGLPLPKQGEGSLLSSVIPRLVKLLQGPEEVLQFETPAMFARDSFSWRRDDEFSRQTLAGVNPYSIQLVTEFPFVSKLDPKIYGPPESAITEEIIDQEITGMTAKEALEQKKLFVLDYHDLLLPFVHKVGELEGTTLYGSRTLFFLTPDGTLKLIAIELTRPASPTKPQWKRVFIRRPDAKSSWLWTLAKAHVCSHDSGYHELVSHWLRTHCCTEAYVIALNRQLSAMHPIYRLMQPHFRYTMEINALARQALINAGGIIETSFGTGNYSMELSSVAYREYWRFDTEALPADLIRRGMAVEDPAAEHGLKLTIEDYPFANDGLLVWSSTRQWVSDYVHRYYPSPRHVQEDYELQNWWTDVRTKGHADKKDEPWWPVLNTQEDLIQVLTTVIWVASAHHAAVNFGQYQYGGYFPNRPTIARTNMPVEDDDSEELTQFWDKPDAALLQCFPSQIQATLVMAVLDVLSSHSPDEEYLGGEAEPAWADDPVVLAAFERFNRRMTEIEGIIDSRNTNKKLLNRCGPGVVPYELLKPFSEPGVTGKGVPNSISI